MTADTPQVRILRQALETLGCESRLALAIGATPIQVQRWLSGELDVPADPFFAALDIVTGRITTLA
jgi:DNA-binding transcriptional regulator YdaS (Cro superfamily)